MNVIAKISCYLERGVVTLKWRKEYLNSVTHTTSVLLRIKNWTDWYIERYSMSTYTGVTNCQKQSGFFGPPCRIAFYIPNCSVFRPRRSRSIAAYSRQTFSWTICRSVGAYVRASGGLSSALWKNGESDPDAVWHCRSNGSRDEAGSGVWVSVHGKRYFWGRIWGAPL